MFCGFFSYLKNNLFFNTEKSRVTRNSIKKSRSRVFGCITIFWASANTDVFQWKKSSLVLSILTTFSSFLYWTLKRENNLQWAFFFLRQWKFFELIFVRGSFIVVEVKEQGLFPSILVGKKMDSHSKISWVL